MRLLDDLTEDFRARIAAAGEHLQPANADGLCTYFLVKEGAGRLRACRASEFAVEMASHGLVSPKVGLVENMDVFLGWRSDFGLRLGLEGCDVILLTRGNELIREMAWLWQAVDANVAQVRCAFDFTPKGLGYFIVACDALGDRCRVAWPPCVDEVFESRRREGGVAFADGSKLASDNPDALRWARLLVEHGVAVRQREFLN